MIHKYGLDMFSGMECQVQWDMCDPQDGNFETKIGIGTMNANPFTPATYMRKWNAVKQVALPPWLLEDLPPMFLIEELMSSVLADGSGSKLG